ncbi:hypothetical protein [Micromonospora deserti]|uniref:hypothetical protein n=1 Tax=Micromonospora deserti TaxID=2070366 RepID=UPI001314A40F|nr:hypothetical protein [Micromonospora deserti]
MARPFAERSPLPGGNPVMPAEVRFTRSSPATPALQAKLVAARRCIAELETELAVHRP